MYQDVLSLVFEAAIDGDPSFLYTIRSVNRQWFDAARNCPRLWSKFDIHCPVHFDDTEYVRFHVENAGGIPLDITITLADDFPYKSDIPAIVELRKAVKKIRSLTINAPFFEAWQKFVSGIGEGQPAPLLERLILKIRRDTHDIENNVPFTTLSTAFTPSPKFVELQMPPWPLPAQPPPQLSTATSLTFETPFFGIDVPSLFPVIQAAPHLRYFKCKALDMGAESDPNYSNIISVPQLRSVDVTIPGHGMDFLGNFHAPLLTQVRLDGYRESVQPPTWDMEDWGIDVRRPPSILLNHLSIHSSLIRQLELKYVHFEFPKEDHVRILSGQAFPALEELILERTNIPDEALMECVGRYSGLTKLKLRNCRSISAHGVRNFVQGGMHSEFVLMLEGCPRISQEDIQSLSEIVCMESI